MRDVSPLPTRRFSLLVLAALACAGSAFAGVPRPDRGRCIEARYEGQVDLEGHYERPGATRRYHSLQRFLSDARGRFRLDWVTWAAGDSAGPPETILVRGDSVFQRSDPARSWRLLTGERAVLARIQAQAGLPWSLRGDRRLRGLVSRSEGGRVLTITAARPHPRLGDVTNLVGYEYDRGDAPSAMRIKLHERDQSWSLAARRSSFRTDVPEDSWLASPAAFEPPPPSPDELREEPTVRALGDGLWAVDQNDVDSRSLVVEFADHLAVVEAAVGSANGERLVNTIRRRWPDKPIRWAFFSHHHPHYAGGIRALIAEGATIVTTPGNAAFVRQVASYRFGQAPDRLARSPRPLELRVFEKRFELADSTNRLVAIDIGQRSTHTDEFAVFWMPRQRLVFETEQGWITVDGTLRASRRAEGFLRALSEEGVEAERLVQSWPMRDNRAEVSRADLEGLIRARAK